MSAGFRPSVWIAAARPRTLPAAVAAVLVGSAFASRHGAFRTVDALLCLGFALLVQVGTNLANDYFDFVKGADTAARVGPRRAVASGEVSPRAMRRVATGVFAAAFATGLGLVAHGGPWMLAVGVASILCGIAYTGGPFPLGYHGFGDIFAFFFFGPVAVGLTYFVQAGGFPRDVLIGAVPIGLLTANILVMNNYRDAETDAAAGKRTLVVRFGRNAAVWQVALSHCAAVAVPFFLWQHGYGLSVLLPIFLAPMASLQVHRLAESRTPAERIRLLGGAARYLALYAVLLSAGILA